MLDQVVLSFYNTCHSAPENSSACYISNRSKWTYCNIPLYVTLFIDNYKELIKETVFANPVI